MGKYQNYSRMVQRKHKINSGEIEIAHTVDFNGGDTKDSFERNLDKWIYFSSWSRWYPDLFMDYIKPDKGGIVLDLDQRVLLRSILRFVSVYGVYPRAYGKCMSLDTYIYTENGLKQLKDYINKKEEYHVVNQKVVNRYGEEEQCFFGLYNGEKDTLKIETDAGYNNECTPNHKLLVLEKDGSRKWKEAKDISIGDFLCVSRNNNVWGDKTSLRNIKEKADTFFEKNEVICFQDFLDEDFSYLLGIVFSENCIRLSDMIGFETEDIFMYKKFIKLLKDKFDYETATTKKYRYNLNSKYLSMFFTELGYHTSLAIDKEVPSIIKESTRENVCGFLKGLFDCNADVYKDDIIIDFYNIDFVNQVQLLLLNLGIVSKKKSVGTKIESCWELKISEDELLKFKKYIGFRTPNKKEKLDYIINGLEKIDKSFEKVPYQKNNVNAVLKEVIESDNIDTQLFKDVCKADRNHKVLTYKMLQRIYNELKSIGFKEEDFDLSNVVKENYYYDKVTNIENGYAKTGDINMPDTNSWLANGVVSHNTFIEVLSLFLICMFYPGTTVAMTAQTQGNAAKMLKDKYLEITKYWPALKEEIKGTPKFQNDVAIIDFNGGSKMDILANSDNSKGQRRRRINIEESELLNNTLYELALAPIVDTPRSTIGKLSMVNPEELSQRINFFTTSGFKGSSEYKRIRAMILDMSKNEGSFVTGADWRLATWYGRGLTIEQVAKKKKNMSSIAFAQNYGSKWVGASENQLVDVAALLKCRNLTKAETFGNIDDEYVFGIDVARSQNEDNNRSSVAVLKIVRNKDNSVKNVELVNLIIIPNAYTFTGQAIEIKRLYERFKPEMCVVDVNGLGIGLKDELLKVQIDPLTGKKLEAWDTTGSDDSSEVLGAPQILYGLYPQQAQSKITVTFMDAVISGKLRLLEKKDESKVDLFTKESVLEYAPFKQTSELIDEIVNLKMKHNKNGSITIERVVTTTDKDRYTSVAYGLWWIMNFSNSSVNEGDSLSDFFVSINDGKGVYNSPDTLLKKIFK